MSSPKIPASLDGGMTAGGDRSRCSAGAGYRCHSYDRQEPSLDGFIGLECGRGASMQQRMIENLKVGPYAMRYSQFVPRLYNLCRSLGFERNRMLPSRAFCSD